MAALSLLRLELNAVHAAAETWRKRCEAAEAALKQHEQRAVRREALKAVTIREITPAHAQWESVTQPRLTLIERVYLWATGQQ